jgi:glutaredoxin
MEKINWLIGLCFVLLLVPELALAQSDVNTTVEAYVFVSKTCPHCAQLEEYLNEIKDDYPYLEVNIYEVTESEENRELLTEMAAQHGIQVQGVPTYFIGGDNFVGYAPYMNQDILAAINSTYEELTANSTTNQTGNHSNNQSNINQTEPNNVKIPLFGNIDATTFSLPLITFIVGFVDGFNPCAFFVLLFLLSMLVHARSKKRMLIIGLTFIFFSGLIYFLFMSAWLNFFMITENVKYITLAAGIVALFIASIDIKDFFAFKKGVSLSISDRQRKSLFSKMRSLLKAESLVSMLIGTVALAVTANLYELLCTVGLPMVFTKILVLNELSTVSYYLYLLFYNIVYILPLLTIVLVFTYTLGSKKLSQSQGEALKLLSGMMMLALGSLLVFAPEYLTNVAVAIGVILLAIVATGIILLIRRFFDKRNKRNITEE